MRGAEGPRERGEAKTCEGFGLFLFGGGVETFPETSHKKRFVGRRFGKRLYRAQ